MCEEIEPTEPTESVECDDETEESEIEDWKTQLRAQFEAWLEEVDEIPEECEPAETPDLYSLFEELAALRNESRQGNRKSAEVFSQVGASLGQFDAELKRLREQMSRSEPANKQSIPRSECLALVQILDRMHRLRAALEREPKPSGLPFFKPDGAWKEAWENLRQGFSIVTMHLETLIQQAGVRPMVTLGAPFDPVCMVAVAAIPSPENAPNTVLEEISPGYHWRDEVLRPAEVSISKSNQL